MTLKAVAAEIGRTHANLLHHFGSAAGLQGELAQSIADSVTGSIAEAVERARAGETDARVIVDQCFDAFGKEGAGALAAWMILTGNRDALNPILDSIRGLVAQLRRRPRGASCRRKHACRWCSTRSATRCSARRSPKRSDLPRDAARELAAQRLRHRLRSSTPRAERRNGTKLLHARYGHHAQVLQHLRDQDLDRGRAADHLRHARSLIIVVWAVTGPMFHYSDTWQLVINTGTTIVTFLMVFLIQNSQNRDGAAMQAKLDELLRAVDKAREQFIGIEHLTDQQIELVRAALERHAKELKEKQAKSSRHAPRTPSTGSRPLLISARLALGRSCCSAARRPRRSPAAAR